MVGQRYGKLVVVRDSGIRKHKNIVWLCQCDCGNTNLVTTNALNMRNTKSCGCAQWSTKLAAGEAGLNELFRSYYRDSRRRDYEFALTLEEFKGIVVRPCFYCGVELPQVKYSRGRNRERIGVHSVGLQVYRHR